VEEPSSSSSEAIRVKIEPGICGFGCVVEVHKKARYTVSLQVSESDCKHVKCLFQNLHEMNMKDLFSPISKNPIFLSAQKAGCHPSCPIPVAALKGVEVAMEMALPRDVTIRFTSRKSKRTHGSDSSL
jgi:hypothetical protein